MDAAEQEASAGAAPRGRLRINSNVAFGYGFLLPLMPGFLEAHPGVTVDITLTDTVVDLLQERADVAIRVGPLRDSSLMTRKLGESRNVVVASPDYLARHGVPRTLDDLMQHNRLGFSFTRIYEGWPFLNASGEIVGVPPAGNALISDGDAMRHLALAGLGIARLSAFHVNRDLADGKLVLLLEDLNPGDISPVTAIFAGQSGYVPARVRALLDYLVENVRLD
jgi:DNA-binding transcriptional LysR family regulator